MMKWGVKDKIRGFGGRLAPPLITGLLALSVWEALVAAYNIPTYVLPAPHAIGAALIAQRASLADAALVTLTITFWAFFWALLTGLAGAIIFTRARLLETALYPYVIILQVTPVVAIAPLILIWVGFDHVQRALIIIAWIVAFFPILTSSVAGLRSVDPDLRDLFTLYQARPWQSLLYLELPAATPEILTGAKISGGLALIGAVVAEFVAGSGNSTGLAWRIIESGNRLDIAAMFASLFLLSIIGIALFYLLATLEWVILRRWHPRYG